MLLVPPKKKKEKKKKRLMGYEYINQYDIGNSTSCKMKKLNLPNICHPVPEEEEETKLMYEKQYHHKFTYSPCSRAMEAERIPRSRFKNVNADSHSEIILVTEEGSPATESDDPTARAACESLRFLKFPRNCNKCKPKK